MVEFASGVKRMALNLESDNVVGTITSSDPLCWSLIKSIARKLETI